MRCVVRWAGACLVASALGLCTAASGASDEPVAKEKPTGERVIDGQGRVLDGGILLPKGANAAGAVNGVALPEGVRVVDLAAARVGCLKTMRLVGAGDNPYVEARYPNAGYLKLSDVLGTNRLAYTGGKMKTHWTSRPERWRDAGTFTLTGCFRFDWASGSVTVRVTNGCFEVVGPRYHYGYHPGGRYFAHGLLCELDVPGEYYVDRAAKKLYYLPRPEDADGRLMLVTDGDAVVLRDAENVVYCNFTVRNFGGAAFRLDGCRNIRVENCTIVNCGRAVEGADLRDCVFDNCRVAHCANGGFNIGGGEARTLERSGNVVRNCRVVDFARESLSYAPAIHFSGCGNTAIGNVISHGPHAGIIFWGPEQQILSNEIHHVCLDAGEMGAIYTGRSLTFAGCRIEGNSLHDIPRFSQDPTRAIMLDDGVAGISIVSNRFLRCTEGICLSGCGNEVVGNVFKMNESAIVRWGPLLVLNDEAAAAAGVGMRQASRQLLSTLEPDYLTEPPWSVKYPYVGLVKAALKPGATRDPSTNARIVGNTFVSDGSPQLRAARKQYEDTRGWTIAGNVEKPLPYAKGLADGERVAFLGDGILADGKIVAYIEDFYRVRYPERKIAFKIFGKRGDTAAEGLSFIEELASYRPTTVVILYGMNDVDRETWTRFSDAAALRSRRKTARTAFRANIAALSKAFKALPECPRLIWMTPTVYDQNCQVDGEVSDLRANDGLALLAEDVRAQAETDRSLCVDLQFFLWQWTGFGQLRDYPTYSVYVKKTGFDRIHPGGPGDLLIAGYFIHVIGDGGDRVGEANIPAERLYRRPKEADGVWGIQCRVDRWLNGK